MSTDNSKKSHEVRDAQALQRDDATAERRPYTKPTVSDFFQPAVVLGTPVQVLNYC